MIPMELKPTPTFLAVREALSAILQKNFSFEAPPQPTYLTNLRHLYQGQLVQFAFTKGVRGHLIFTAEPSTIEGLIDRGLIPSPGSMDNHQRSIRIFTKTAVDLVYELSLTHKDLEVGVTMPVLITGFEDATHPDNSQGELTIVEQVDHWPLVFDCGRVDVFAVVSN